jgi:hypothetical protein
VEKVQEPQKPQNFFNYSIRRERYIERENETLKRNKEKRQRQRKKEKERKRQGQREKDRDKELDMCMAWVAQLVRCTVTILTYAMQL